MHFKRILIDPIVLIEEMVIDDPEFNPFNWSIRDAEILELTAKMIRRGNTPQPNDLASGKSASSEEEIFDDIEGW